MVSRLQINIRDAETIVFDDGRRNEDEEKYMEKLSKYERDAVQLSWKFQIENGRYYPLYFCFPRHGHRVLAWRRKGILYGCFPTGL